MNRYALIILIIFAASSCTPVKESAYFKTIQQDATMKKLVTPDFDTRILPGDQLSINISSLSPTDDAFFNSTASTGMARETSRGYTVSKTGTIELHKLGEVRVEGLTRQALADQLKDSLIPYLKEPRVAVNFLNHKLTVLGEVRSPQVLYMPEEKVSVLEALVLSGDITENGRREKIMVIRDEDSVKRFKYLNLEDHSVFNSDYFYLKNNDILYVLPDTSEIEKTENRRRLQTTLSLVASGVSLLIIVVDRLIR